MPNSDLRGEMKAPVEPLLPVEKTDRLEPWVGLALLVLLVLLNRIAPLN